MEREQQPTIIDLDDHWPRRASVATAVVVVLVALLAIAPFVIDDASPSTEATSISMPAGHAAPPAVCYPSFDIPQMLDPLASVVIPGWTRLCGWLTQPAIADPLDPSG